jgi:Uri superfamily endonuclease
MKGTYILLIQLTKDRVIDIGKLGSIDFKKGWYTYIGSGLNSLESRINRHLKSTKKLHWHIDYFLHEANIKYVFYKEGLIKEECDVANVFCQFFKSVLDFGCSDCSCSSHLFYGKKTELTKVIADLDFNQYIE